VPDRAGSARLYSDFKVRDAVDTVGCSGVAFVMDDTAGTEVVDADEAACPPNYPLIPA